MYETPAGVPIEPPCSGWSSGLSSCAQAVRKRQPSGSARLSRLSRLQGDLLHYCCSASSCSPLASGQPDSARRCFAAGIGMASGALMACPLIHTRSRRSCKHHVPSAGSCSRCSACTLLLKAHEQGQAHAIKETRTDRRTWSPRSSWNKYWTEHRRLLESATLDMQSDPDKKVNKRIGTVPWRRLFAEFKSEARLRYIIPATILSVVLTGITATRAHLTGRMIDLALKVPKVEMAVLKSFCLAYITAASMDYVLDVVRSILFALARWEMSMSMRKKVFANLLVQEQAFFEQRPAGELTSRLVNDVDQMQETLNRTPEKLIVEVVRLLTAITIMFRKNMLLSAVATIPLPFVLRIVKMTARVVGFYGVAQNDAMAKVNRVSDEALRNSRTVQAHAAHKEELGAYHGSIDEYLRVIRHTLFTETLLRFSRRLLFDAGTDVPLFCLCVILIYKGQLTIGSFYTFRFVLFQYRRAFNELNDQYTGLRKVQEVSRRYFELLDRKPLIANPESSRHSDSEEEQEVEALQPGQLEKDGLLLEFDNVSFAYRQDRVDGTTQYALKGVSFKLRPGECIAIVGHSGAGKSTVAKLCLRFYDPQEGAIRLGGVDLRDWDLTALRRCMGVVDQDPVLFNRSILQNLRYGLDDTIAASNAESLDQVREVARVAAADEFIMQLPEKYDTICGERGSRLSGGQRQRVALARALVRNPRLLLLDEHSSSLDAMTEAAVTAALESARKDRSRSTLLIAHRLATVRSADRILVLESGELVEEGSPQELLHDPESRYKALVSTQMVQA